MRTETATEVEITLPYRFEPRSYQWRLYDAWDRGIRRFGLVWHRRAGKDKCCLNFCIEQMMSRVGNYYHIFPKQNQGRRIIWTGIDKLGMRYLDHFPPDLLYCEPNNSDMIVTLVHPDDRTQPGSTYQILGTDRNLDVLVGGNGVGLIFSEYALQNPQGWRIAQPILRENGGWAMFPYTPRGKNHGYDLYRTNITNPDWYFELLTVDDTRRDGPGENGGPVITPDDIEADKREGMTQDLIDQEYYLSFDAAIPGAYYANEFRSVDQERRITRVPYDPSYPVYTFWDIGIDDANSLWFAQFVGRQICLIHYYENSGYGAPHYADYLKSLPYQGNYRAHFLPHDGRNREWTTGERREVALQRQVQGQVLVADRPSVDAGIAQVRTMFPRLLFDEVGCGEETQRQEYNHMSGIVALREYKHAYDEVNKVFANHPAHDFASHGADALRTMAVSLSRVDQLDKQYAGRVAGAIQPVQRPRVRSVRPGGGGWMR